VLLGLDEELAGGAVVPGAVVEGVVTTVVEVRVVATEPLLEAGAEPEAEPEVEEPAGAELLETGLPTQLLSLDVRTVKAADWARAPLLSRRVKPIEVPEAMLTTHVSEVPVWVPKSTRGAAVG